MSQEASPRLSHVGIYVTDLPKMIDFYTRVLGFVVSDAAPDGRITFLSRNPSDHHQVVLAPGRQTDHETPMVQQIERTAVSTRAWLPLVRRFIIAAPNSDRRKSGTIRARRGAAAKSAPAPGRSGTFYSI